MKKDYDGKPKTLILAPILFNIGNESFFDIVMSNPVDGLVSKKQVDEFAEVAHNEIKKKYKNAKKIFVIRDCGFENLSGGGKYKRLRRNNNFVTTYNISHSISVVIENATKGRLSYKNDENEFTTLNKTEVKKLITRIYSIFLMLVMQSHLN